MAHVVSLRAWKRSGNVALVATVITALMGCAPHRVHDDGLPIPTGCTFESSGSPRVITKGAGNYACVDYVATTFQTVRAAPVQQWLSSPGCSVDPSHMDQAPVTISTYDGAGSLQDDQSGYTGHDAYVVSSVVNSSSCDAGGGNGVIVIPANSQYYFVVMHKGKNAALISSTDQIPFSHFANCHDSNPDPNPTAAGDTAFFKTAATECDHGHAPALHTPDDSDGGRTGSLKAMLLRVVRRFRQTELVFWIACSADCCYAQ